MIWLTRLRSWWKLRRIDCRLRRYSPEARAAPRELGMRRRR